MYHFERTDHKGPALKSMNFLEFQAAIERIRDSLNGTQLQDFSIEDKDLILLFYSRKSIVLRLSLKSPPVLFFEIDTFKMYSESRKVPMALFLSRHFLRKTVTEIKFREEWGRRFEIHFQDESGATFYMDVVLVPGFQNIGLFAGGKRIHWQKPRALSESVAASTNEVSEFRSMDRIREEWYGEVKSSHKAPVEKDWKNEVQKKIKKKNEAIEKIRQQSEENKIIAERFYSVGELLKYQSKSELSEEDKKSSQGLDREQLFKKGKGLLAKKNGMAQRIEILENEIQTLSHQLEEGYSAPPPNSKHNTSIAGKSTVNTRKLEIDSTLNLYMGKNAKDNVQLLKSSQPYEIWFHLKDYPSAYAITRRKKGVPIGHSELVKMSTWFAKECFKNNKEKSPSHIEVIYTECRFVKLLKGDRLGRVTYTNTKTLRISIA